jgi:pimeloyl-ACP methyl ester carboxylesterase
MSAETYVPGYKAFDVKEVHDLMGTGMSAGMPTGLTCRWPAGAAPKACVVFGHGLGENARSYAGLCAYWAVHGYLVIQPSFADWIEALAAEDPEIGHGLEGRDAMSWATYDKIRPKVLAKLHQPFYWLDRIRIVREVLDGADAIMAATCGAPAEPVPFAIAGHSFGAYLSQVLAGARIDVPGKGPTVYKEERFRAAILLSAQGRDQQGLCEGSWDTMTGPVLNVTGTRDGGAKGQDWHWKCEPYDFAPPGDKYLAVFEDAAHYLGGIGRETRLDDNPDQREAVAQLTLAFLDAHVAGDTNARAWLAAIRDRIGNCPVLFKRK